MNRLLLLLLALVCAACASGEKSALDAALVPTAQALSEQPAPLPEFLLLTTVRESGGIFSTSALCVVINAGTLWLLEETNFTIERRILETTQFVIDQRPIDPDTIYFRSEPNLITQISDERGELLGSYGSPVRACIPLDDFAPGLHLATVTVTDYSEFTHRHDWTFVIR